MSVSTVSSIGSSLATSGSVPTAAPALSAAAPSTKLSPYETEFQTLGRQDTAELLYASFLSPADSLSNGNAVLSQAAQLLGTPGEAPAASSTTVSSASEAPAAPAPPTVPSVSSVLAASDAAAQSALAAYAQAPAGSSILDYQA